MAERDAGERSAVCWRSAEGIVTGALAPSEERRDDEALNGGGVLEAAPRSIRLVVAQRDFTGVVYMQAAVSMRCERDCVRAASESRERDARDLRAMERLVRQPQQAAQMSRWREFEAACRFGPQGSPRARRSSSSRLGETAEVVDVAIVQSRRFDAAAHERGPCTVHERPRVSDELDVAGPGCAHGRLKVSDASATCIEHEVGSSRYEPTHPPGRRRRAAAAPRGGRNARRSRRRGASDAPRSGPAPSARADRGGSVLETRQAPPNERSERRNPVEVARRARGRRRRGPFAGAPRVTEHARGP